MKLTLLIVFFGLMFFSPFTGMNTEHPEPDWVEEIMDKRPRMTKITKCSLGDDYVWKLNSCVTCADMMVQVYDRDKNLLCQYGGVLKLNTCEEKDLDVFEECEVIYKPKVRMGFGW